MSLKRNMEKCSLQKIMLKLYSVYGKQKVSTIIYNIAFNFAFFKYNTPMSLITANHICYISFLYALFLASRVRSEEN